MFNTKKVINKILSDRYGKDNFIPVKAIVRTNINNDKQTLSLLKQAKLKMDTGREYAGIAVHIKNESDLNRLNKILIKTNAYIVNEARL